MVTLRIFSMGECPFDFDYTVDCIDSSTGFDFERSFCGLFRIDNITDQLIYTTANVPYLSGCHCVPRKKFAKAFYLSPVSPP